jgi:hypothetical protein
VGLACQLGAVADIEDVEVACEGLRVKNYIVHKVSEIK